MVAVSTEGTGKVKDGEIIDWTLLQALAVLAKASERPLVDELNTAIASYVCAELPCKLGDAGVALFLEDVGEAESLRRWLSPSPS